MERGSRSPSRADRRFPMSRRLLTIRNTMRRTTASSRHGQHAPRLACTVLLVLSGVAVARAADVEARNEGEFAKVVAKDAKVEKLAGGLKFVEGPVWTDAEGGLLVFSDIPADELKQWTKADGVK